ncbi:hypothetical protein CEXT_293841 [Caerostris extrusa]|uniref:Uncharacterized protein n=1 Tax=Caerostris extrusa TaxID=172846 RepID=A0AAV4R002_CAEEX|nr:hypothetical protein CEXT_293841 [Caerostris extrusa]
MDSVQTQSIENHYKEQSPQPIITRLNKIGAYLLSKTDATLSPWNLLIDFVVITWIISLPEYLMNGRDQQDSKDPQLYSLIKISEVR